MKHSLRKTPSHLLLTYKYGESNGGLLGRNLVLEAEGNLPRALEEYSALAGYFPGAEAAVRYAQLLRRQQQIEAARKVLRDLVDQAALAPAHYRRTQADWLKQAERELGEI